MDCGQCRETVSAVLDREAGDREFAAAALHLAGCSACRATTTDALDVAGLGWERLSRDTDDDAQARRAVVETAWAMARGADASHPAHGGPRCRPSVVRLHPVDATECGCSTSCACGCQSGARCRCSGHAA